MNWELTGVGPGNSGAELMALAILSKVPELDRAARLCMAPSAHAPYTWRAQHGLFQIWNREQSGRLGWLRERLFHAGYRSRFGILTQHEIDIILDAAGFALGDAWEPEGIERVADHYEAAATRGARIVLLPQAFGPFEQPRIRDASRRVLATASLVFARDPESLNHAKELIGESDILQLAPDFTSLLLPEETVEPQAHSDRVAFVPNRQMLSGTGDATEEAYVSAFARSIVAVENAGLSPFILIHETGDRELGERIARSVKSGVSIEQGHSALDNKATLGRCAMAVCSRYHAIINCLSQAVPCIGTAWSHKYKHLFAEYGAAELLITDLASLPEQALTVSVSETLSQWRNHLESCRSDRLAASQACWEQVAALAGCRQRAMPGQDSGH